MLNGNQRNALALAALQHDIGKFKQRADFAEDRGKTHSIIGYEWLSSQYGEGLIAAAARNHHSAERETWESNLSIAIYEADNCAASERPTRMKDSGDEVQKWHREVQLAGIFGRVRNPGKESPGEKDYPPPTYCPLTTVDQWGQPVEMEGTTDAGKYSALWSRFEDEFQQIRELGNHWSTDVVMHLLEKYTSFIPSITLKTYGEEGESLYRKHPDISLFDHLKSTAAIASCLVDYVAFHHPEGWRNSILKEPLCGESTWGEAEHPFLLVGGDISGVQRFIYTISSKGALKSLKGRSFFLELFTEHAVHCLLEAMQLSRCNVIFTGGGHFYLIAPNLPSTEEAVKQVRESLNGYLFEAFNGELQLFVEAVRFGKRTFADTAEVWGALSGKLEDAKRRKWSSMLDTLLAPPAMPDPSCLTQNCDVCGREDQPLEPLALDKTDVLACEYCRIQYLVGDTLQKAIRKGGRPLILKYVTEPPEKDVFRIGQAFYRIVPGTEKKDTVFSTKNLQTVYHVNSWSLGEFRFAESRPLLAGLYLPNDEELRDLESMATSGFGMERLAALRMDVDRLGRVFSSAVCSKERTFSRMAALSRNLSLFFKYHLNGILERRPGYPVGNPAVPRQQNEERRLVLVYSGGDDLFLLGHWLDVTEAAHDIERGFQCFTGNPFLTVSAGITLGGIHDPVYRLANESGKAEERAKDAKRNRITLFDHHTVTWEEMGEVRRLLSLLLKFFNVEERQLSLPNGSLSRGFLYSLLMLARESGSSERGQSMPAVSLTGRPTACETAKLDRTQWVFPKLAYLFGRASTADNYTFHLQVLQDEAFCNAKFAANKWLHWEIALIWVLMMTRTGEKA